jgi:tetratricopeptide (TPR) repeat protein
LLERYKEACFSCINSLEIDPKYHYAWEQLGFILSEMGDNEGSVTAYIQAAKLDPNNNSYWHSLGRELNKLDWYNEAIFAFDKAIELEPDDYRSWTHKARSLSMLGKHKEAINTIEIAANLNPEEYYYPTKGLVLSKAGHSLEAVSVLESALKSNPDCWYSRLLLSNSLYDLRNYEKSLEACNIALEFLSECVSDKAIPYHKNSIKYWRKYYGEASHQSGKNLDKLKQYSKAYQACVLAINAYEALDDTDSILFELYYHLAFYFGFIVLEQYEYNIPEDLEYVMAKIRKARSILIKIITTAINENVSLISIKDWLSYRRVLPICIKILCPCIFSMHVFFVLGKFFILKFKTSIFILLSIVAIILFVPVYKVTISFFDKLSITFKYWKATGYFATATNLFERKDYLKALFFFDKAIDVLEKHKQTILVASRISYLYFMKGASLRYLARHEDSIVMLDKAISFQKISESLLEDEINQKFFGLLRFWLWTLIMKNPKSTYSRTARIWYVRGLALKASERYEESIANFELAIKNDNRCFEAWCKKGMLLSILDRDQESLNSYDEAIHLNSKLADPYYGKAIYYAKKDNVSQVCLFLKKAIELDLEFHKQASIDPYFDKFHNDDTFQSIILDR